MLTRCHSLHQSMLYSAKAQMAHLLMTVCDLDIWEIPKEPKIQVEATKVVAGVV